MHKKWLDRNKDKDWVPEHQKLPYNQLSREEQLKDVAIIERAIQLFIEAAAKAKRGG
jgi:hypothetical protein